MTREYTYDTIMELRAKYKLIVWWHTTSYDYYINDLVLRADNMDAPLNTVYFEEGKPVTTDTVQNLTILRSFINGLLETK